MVALLVGLSTGNPQKVGIFTAWNRTQTRPRTPPEKISIIRVERPPVATNLVSDPCENLWVDIVFNYCDWCAHDPNYWDFPLRKTPPLETPDCCLSFKNPQFERIARTIRNFCNGKCIAKRAEISCSIFWRPDPKFTKFHLSGTGTAALC